MELTLSLFRLRLNQVIRLKPNKLALYKMDRNLEGLNLINLSQSGVDLNGLNLIRSKQRDLNQVKRAARTESWKDSVSLAWLSLARL